MEEELSQLAIDGGTPVRTKPFPVWPVWGQEEIQYLTEVVKSGQWGCLKGKKTEQFARMFAEYQQAKYGICVNSGTTALQIALAAADVEPGKKVIVPAYTFIATAGAVVESGCIPVFVDIDPGTYNIDVESARTVVDENTAAVMPVHFAGRPADMDAVMDFAKEYNLKVIEDAAQAWGTEWKNRRVGAIGDAGCFSFQSSKNISAGEGGIIVTNDEIVAKMADAHHNCGRSQEGKWYEHYYFGGNYRMTEFQSAVLLAQFERYDELKQIRQVNLKYLNAQLKEIDRCEPLSDDANITSHASHLYIFKYKKEHFRRPKSEFLNALRKEGIPASPGYSLPLYKQPVFLNRAFGPRGKMLDLPVNYSKFYCPEAEKACYDEAIWLTQNVLLGTEKDMDDIVAALKKLSVHFK
jgi:dTDP-4-amino-4,6-dideoxygalactose transaminase